MNKLDKIKPYTPIAEKFDIRLDANESCFDLPKAIKKELCKRIAEVNFNRYPDPFAQKACSLFAQYVGVPVQSVVAGNGSDELISLIFQTFCYQGDNVLLFTPDFAMYQFYCNLLGLPTFYVQKKENFRIDFAKAERVLAKYNIKVCILSNPCNPTSIQEKKEKLLKLLKFKKTLFVVDEAYMEFGNQSLLGEFENYDNLIILKTLSKACGLASIRMGFAVANKELIDELKRTKSPYNVNALSQTTAEVILEKPKIIAKNVATIKRLTKKLKMELEKFDGFEVIDGKTNFVTVKIPEKEWEIDWFLRQNSISVKRFEGFLRITCGTEQENARLIETLRSKLKSKN